MIIYGVRFQRWKLTPKLVPCWKLTPLGVTFQRVRQFSTTGGGHFRQSFNWIMTGRVIFQWGSIYNVTSACLAIAYTDYLNLRYSFVIVALHCNYYSYLTNLLPEIRKMISDNSSLHASRNTGYHSHNNGSWRNAPEMFSGTERPEEI